MPSKAGHFFGNSKTQNDKYTNNGLLNYGTTKYRFR